MRYRVRIIDEDIDNDIPKYPIGYLTIEDNKYTYKPLKSFGDSLILDRESNNAYKLNTEIKKIYDIPFQCNIYFLDKNVDENSKLDEKNIFVIPQGQSQSANKIQAYLDARLKYNKPSIEILDKATIYKIQNSNLVKMSVGDMLSEVAQRKGIKLYTEPIKQVNPRYAEYPVYRYANYSKRSGVYAYAFNSDETIIYVYFLGKKRAWYKYDIQSAPKYVIKEMIRRAVNGWGLNRYINAHPKTYYWKGNY